MQYLHFVGIVISSGVTDQMLHDEFDGSCIDWRHYGGRTCLFHKGKSMVSSEAHASVATTQHIALTKPQIWRLIGTLKRVRNDALYSMYPDDFGTHHVPLRTVVAIKLRQQTHS